MGLFGKKPPPEPLPTLTTHLHTPADKIFKPNDTVSGYVTLVTPIPINPLAVEISFWGLSSVWLRTSHSTNNNSTDYTHYRDNAVLFDLTFDALTSGPPQDGVQQPPQYQPQENMGLEEKGCAKDEQGKKEYGELNEKEISSSESPPSAGLLVPGQTYTYPFQFRVPEGTGFNRSGFYKLDTDERWTISPHHLPPSMLYGQKKEWPDRAYVEYGVTSRLICPGIFIDKKTQEPVSSTAEILFAPLNPHADAPFTVVRFPKTLTLASSALSGLDKEKIGFRQSMKDRFSKETPKLDFEIGIEVPDYLTTGAEFRFRTSFIALSRSENVVTIPEITFTVLKLELLDFTFVRAPRDFEASRQMSGWHHNGTSTLAPQGPIKGSPHEDDIYRERKTFLNSLPAGTQTLRLEELPVVGEKDRKGSEQAKSCEMWFTARVPGLTPPSFKSFAITRCYRVRVKMGIEIGGKKFESDVEGVVNSLGSAP